MIKACSDVPRKSSEIFGYPRKSLECFENVGKRMWGLENLRKRGGNLRKIVTNVFISMLIE